MISRKDTAFKNIFITMLCQIIYIIVSFICRTVFTKILGAEYLGLNGLFSNILTMLSFVELGLGSALVYKLYKPLATNDKEMICIYMQFYKKVYFVIAITVTCIGLFITPFLNYIVDAPNVDINIHIVYLLFLLDSVISYLYVYKKSILIADQKNYIVAVYTQVFNAIMNIGQIVLLVFTHNYILYLLFKIICDWLNNVFCSKKAENDYPFINKKTHERIQQEDREELVKDVKGLMLGKLASVTFDGTDNIFISMFSGIASVGIISNYTLILTTLNSLFNQVFNALTSSIGHLGATSPKAKVEEVLQKLYFFNSLLYGYLFVGIVLLLRMLVVEIWVGPEYNLPFLTVFLLVLELVLRGIHYPVYIVRTAMGLFHQLKYIPPICAAINIGLDYVLGYRFGIAGIVIATIVARLITRTADIYVLYTYCFKQSCVKYYKRHIKMLCFVFLCSVISFAAIQIASSLSVVIKFVSDIVIISFIYWGVALLLFRKTDEFHFYFELIKSKLVVGRKI